MQVLQTNIEWAKQEKRIFLKQSLETRLVGLYALPSPLISQTERLIAV